MSSEYVHGYREREGERLADQAGTLVELLHGDTSYPSVDISEESVAVAERRVEEAGLANVELRQANMLDPPFESSSFDHLFVCFVLEHLPAPAAALERLAGLVRPGGTVTVIEGDHGSAYFHPDSAAARAAIDRQVQLQANAGGDALIGRRVYPLMVEAGLADVCVSPRFVYVDSSRPELVDGFTRKTFTAMVEGVREPALAAGLIEAGEFDAGVRDLRRTTEADGTFAYTFFKGVGTRP